MEKFKPLRELMVSPPVVKCPAYWECGDYATWGRPGSRPGKLEVRCGYHAQRIERMEAETREESEPLKPTIESQHEASFRHEEAERLDLGREIR